MYSGVVLTPLEVEYAVRTIQEAIKKDPPLKERNFSNSSSQKLFLIPLEIIQERSPLDAHPLRFLHHLLPIHAE